MKYEIPLHCKFVLLKLLITKSKCLIKDDISRFDSSPYRRIGQLLYAFRKMRINVAFQPLHV